nr:uridylate kinase [Tanacetum cinerariifolium]
MAIVKGVADVTRLGIELTWRIVLKATNVYGVYEEDPMSNPDTRLHDTLTCQEVILTLERPLCSGLGRYHFISRKQHPG